MTGAIAFLVRRLAAAAVLLVLLILITFTLFFKIPGEPASFLLNPQKASPEEIEAAREALGVEQSVPRQFAHYVWRAVQGDFGLSWGGLVMNEDGSIEGTSVTAKLRDAAPVTGMLVLGGLCFMLLIAVPAGIMAARRPNSIFDRVPSMLSTTAIATHPLVVALLLQLFLAKRLGWLPERGYCPLVPIPESERIILPPGTVLIPGAQEPCVGGPANWAEHLLLPWITFGIFFTALYLRMIRTRLLETLEEPYIRTARAKGASETRIVRVHTLRTGMTPILSMLGLDVGLAVGIAIYVEGVYQLPGIGQLTLSALNFEQLGFDLPLIQGIVLFTGVVIVAVNLLIDAFQVAIDPRLRERANPRA